MLVAVQATGAPASDGALVQLIAQGDIAAARALFRTGAPNRVDWQFFEARVAKAEGRYADAAAQFRAVLRQDPGHMPARRELAHTAYLAGDDRAAARQFAQLLRTDPDPEQRRGYRHFLARIDARRPFTLRGTFAIVSSSNINRGSARDVFRPGGPGAPAFEITDKAEPATGVALSLTARRTWRPAHDASWALDWGADLRAFEDPDHDSTRLFARASFTRARGSTRWSIGPTVGVTWHGDGETQRAFGLEAAAERQRDHRTTRFASARAERLDYTRETAKSGPFYSARLGLAQQRWGGVLTLGGHVSIHRPDTAHQRYTGLGGFAQFSRTWSGGFGGDVGLDIGRRLYGADFPLLGAAREDDFVRLSVSARHDALRLGRLTPGLRCTFGVTRSNVAFFNHDVSECNLRLERRF